ncbi:hypothetical protein PMAYCL1PPCAC_20858, partial [Pristionchus mayeri]
PIIVTMVVFDSQIEILNLAVPAPLRHQPNADKLAAFLVHNPDAVGILERFANRRVDEIARHFGRNCYRCTDRSESLTRTCGSIAKYVLRVAFIISPFSRASARTKSYLAVGLTLDAVNPIRSQVNPIRRAVVESILS